MWVIKYRKSEIIEWLKITILDGYFGNRTIRPKKYDSAWPNKKQRIVAAFLSFLFGQGRIVWVEKYIELYNSANAYFLCFLFGQKWCVIKKKIHCSANWSDFFLFLNWLVAECDIICAIRPKNIFNLATTILKEGEGRRIAANNLVYNSQHSSLNFTNCLGWTLGTLWTSIHTL